MDELGGHIRLARALSGQPYERDTERHDAQLQLNALRQQAQHLLDSIHAQGVYVKGVEPALLDFPALRDGREVYLCWREGEGRVEFWHPVHTGFADRRRLGAEDLCSWEWMN